MASTATAFSEAEKQMRYQWVCWCFLSSACGCSPIPVFLIIYHLGLALLASPVVDQKPVLLSLALCRNEQCLGDSSLVPVTWHPLNMQERCFVSSLFKGARHSQSILVGQDLCKVHICISSECLLCRTVQNRVCWVFWYLRDSLKIAGHLWLEGV